MNIQDEMQKIHHKFGVSEMANYKIEQFIENLIKKDRAKQLTLTDVVDSKRFTETDLLNGYQAGCIEGLDECCDLGLDDLKEIKEDGEKWVKRYTE